MKRLIALLLYGNRYNGSKKGFPNLEAGEVGDPRAADQVGDGLARVLDGTHELFEVLFVCVRFRCIRTHIHMHQVYTEFHTPQFFCGGGGGI